MGNSDLLSKSQLLLQFRLALDLLWGEIQAETVARRDDRADEPDTSQKPA